MQACSRDGEPCGLTLSIPLLSKSFLPHSVAKDLFTAVCTWGAESGEEYCRQVRPDMATHFRLVALPGWAGFDRAFGGTAFFQRKAWFERLVELTLCFCSQVCSAM